MFNRLNPAILSAFLSKQTEKPFLQKDLDEIGANDYTAFIYFFA